ncbi:MAG: hydrolase, partial [Desulforhopalus sp.]
MIDEIEHKLKVRHLRTEDYAAIKEISDKVYKGVAPPWTEKEIGLLIKKFPEGQICIEDNGKAVAIALSLIIDFSLFGDQHSYNQIVSNGTFKSHDREGDYL